MNNHAFEKLNIFFWVKDHRLRFIDCSENFAAAAGYDSPQQLIGKTDFDVIWRNRAEFYQKTDIYSLQGHQYFNQYAPWTTITDELDTLVNKCQLLNKSGKCIGIMGSHIDITGFYLTKKNGYYDPENEKFYLGSQFDNEYLTKRETEVFNYILLGYSAKRIAQTLNISPRTAEAFIDNLKLKFKCNSKGEITNIAIKYGFIYLLDLI